METNNLPPDNKVVYIDESEKDPAQHVSDEYTETSSHSENIVIDKTSTIVPDSIYEDDKLLFGGNLSEKKEFQESNGYESDGGYSDASSVSTNQILSIDPLYLRLTKFLQSEDGTSVAQTLKDIHKELVSLNTSLSNTKL